MTLPAYPWPTVTHIGRSTIQDTHPDLLSPAAIRAVLDAGRTAPARVALTPRALQAANDPMPIGGAA